MRLLVLLLVVLTMIAVAVLLLSGEVTVGPEDALDERGESEVLEAPLPAYEAPAPPLPATIPDPAAEPEPAPPEASPTPALAGRPRTNLLVRVVDERNRPVPRATLFAARIELDEWLGENVPVVDGVASVRRPNDRRSDVSDPPPPGGNRLTLQVTNPTDADGVPLNLLETTVEVDDIDQDELLIELAFGRQLTGNVRDDAGAPVEGLTITAGSPSSFSASKETTTDADGAYRIVALPIGTLEVRLPRDEVWVPLGRIPLPEGQDTLDLALERRLDLEVLVVDPHDRPVEGLRVVVQWGRHGRHWTEKGTSDADGKLIVQGVPARSGFILRTEPTDEGPHFPQVMDLQMRYGDGTYVLRLPRSVTIEGMLVYEGGTSAPHGTVWARGLAEGARHVRTSTSVVRGRFTLRRLAPGPYALTARDPSGNHALVQAVTVEAPRLDVRLVLKTCATVKGVVLDMPEDQVVIQWSVHEWAQQTRADAEGEFALHGVPDDKGTILAFTNRREGDLVGVLENVRPSEGPFEVRLEPELAIRGKVEDWPYGAPGSTPYAPRLLCCRGQLRLSVAIQEDGTFERSRLAKGTWTFELVHVHEIHTLAERVAAGTENLELELPPTLR